MFPTIGDPAADDMPDTGDEFLPGYKTREDALKALEEMKAANARYDADLKSTKASVETMQSMLDQLMAGQTPRREPETQVDDGFDLKSLPDPVEDKDGFIKGVFGAVDRLVQARTEQTAQGLTRQQQLDRLWNRFMDVHKDLAEFPEIVETAVKEVVQDTANRGVNPERFMLGQTDRFFTKVASTAQEKLARLRAKFGIADDDDEGDDSDEPIRRSAPERDRGLSGSSKGRHVTDRTGDGGKLGSLIDDLKKIQRTSGFF